MADIGGIGGLLQGIVQRNASTAETGTNDETEENLTTTETEDVTQSAGSDTTDGAARIGEGLAFQPVTGTGTDQNTSEEATGEAGRVVEDQVSLSTQARQALEEAQDNSTNRSPAEQIREDATDPTPNLAFDAADRSSATADRAETETNQIEVVENDSGTVVGNADVSNFSNQNRELGQLVDQFA